MTAASTAAMTKATDIRFNVTVGRKTLDHARAERDEALGVLESLMQYVGGWDAAPDHPCGKARDLLKKYGRPKAADSDYARRERNASGCQEDDV